ncbi:Serine/threonine-protein kinase SAPK10 [Porphyridium purpureum]|uniref:Serine/threonine-protein kinase SAPK10 n=1 Tax=Porphyridium purpureum TaxID=35688 RepID=A0A5J4YI09_PORPP|nr:Serine/threonine-protein kinase SAPK10 [Porphyridium purpureum]|eukprot:POR4836..scf251_18
MELSLVIMLPEIDGYKVIRALGAGRSGTTYLAVRDGKEVAAKCISRGDRVDEHAEREIFIQRALRSRRTVKLQRVILTQTHLVLILDVCLGGDLFSLLKERANASEDTVLAESQAWKLLREVLLSLRYLHRRRIAHRDIKPENILLTTGNIDMDDHAIKLCDFGFSVVYEGEETEATAKSPSSASSSRSSSKSALGDGTFDVEGVEPVKSLAAVGTTAYVAPEVLDDDLPDYDPFAADIWSVGVLFYTMLSPCLPFQDPLDMGKNYKGMVERIKQGRYRRLRRGKYSDAAEEVIRRSFEVDPAQRISLGEMLQIAQRQINRCLSDDIERLRRAKELTPVPQVPDALLLRRKLSKVEQQRRMFNELRIGLAKAHLEKLGATDMESRLESPDSDPSHHGAGEVASESDTPRSMPGLNRMTLGDASGERGFGTEPPSPSSMAPVGRGTIIAGDGLVHEAGSPNAASSRAECAPPIYDFTNDDVDEEDVESSCCTQSVEELRALVGESRTRVVRKRALPAARPPITAAAPPVPHDAGVAVHAGGAPSAAASDPTNLFATMMAGMAKPR